ILLILRIFAAILIAIIVQIEARLQIGNTKDRKSAILCIDFNSGLPMLPCFLCIGVWDSCLLYVCLPVDCAQ
ncbi:hypothetical protein, partial [uncultured Muribaculum sp.]|uniref:hypothetical protein n=1 Tax=uncultured Muribaculum sp. TaxID=1918613 RepID=UPI0025AF3C5B